MDNGISGTPTHEYGWADGVYVRKEIGAKDWQQSFEGSEWKDVIVIDLVAGLPGLSPRVTLKNHLAAVIASDPSIFLKI